jgi:uncharacterized protein YggE
MRIAWSVAVVLLLTVVGVHADESGGITVQGTGEVRVRPDVGVVSLGVQTQGQDPQKTAAENATLTSQVIAAAKGAGVAEKDVRTSGYALAPQYDYHGQAQGKPPTITGYQVSNSVRVTVRKIDDVGKVLDAGVKAGANVAGGISFELDEPTAAQARDAAVQKAVADAVHKAKVIADAAGVAQTRLVAISEGAVSVPRPRFEGAMNVRAMAMETPTPVAPGEATVSAEVSVRYAIGATP